MRRVFLVAIKCMGISWEMTKLLKDDNLIAVH